MATQGTAFHFTKKAILSRPLPPAGQREILRDTDRKGLTLLVTSSGARSFYLRRMVNGQTIKHRLGSFDDMSIEQARDIVLDMTAALARGSNLTSRLVTTRNSPTLDEYFERWMKDYSEVHRARTAYHDRSVYKANVKEALGAKKLLTIGMAEVQSLHSAIGKSGRQRTANNVLQLLSTMFNRATEWGLYPHPNPTLGIRRFKEKSRERYLGPAELRQLFQAMTHKDTDTDTCDLVLLALLTGARRGNLFAMEWSELDLGAGVWTVDGEKTKTGDDYHIMLAGPAIATLAARQARAPRGQRWVFPADTDSGHIYTIHKRWRDLLKLAGIDDFHFHDLRHTSAAWQVYAGASLPVIGKTLGHRSINTTARYAHVDLTPARASIEQGTAKMLELGGFQQVMDGAAKKVSPKKKGGTK
jgi:integrase